MGNAAFIYVLISATDTIIDNLVLKNVTFTSDYPFLSILYQKQAYVTTSTTLTNWNIQDMYDLNAPAAYSSQGMIIRSQASYHTLKNITVNNLQLKSKIVRSHYLKFSR